MPNIACAYCGKAHYLCEGHVNRALKKGLNLYCGRKCSGLSRRMNKTEQQKKEEKRLYDEQYRAKNIEMLKEKKREYHKHSYDPVIEAQRRKLKMPRHIEYCRHPEYREWKSGYDKQYRAKRYHGDFWESFLVLQDIEKEIATRVTRTEIYTLNGTLNKHQQRRRAYERSISKQS